MDDQPNYSDEFSKIIFGENAKTIEKNWCKYKLEFENRLKEIDKDNILLINQKNVISEISTTVDINFTLEPLIILMDKINLNYSRIPNNSEPKKIKDWLNNQKIILKSFKMEMGNILKRIDINNKEELQQIYLNKNKEEQNIINRLNSISNEVEILYIKIDQIKEPLNKLMNEKPQMELSSKELQKQVETYNVYSFIYGNIDKANDVLKLVSIENEKAKYIKKLVYIKNKWENLLETAISDLNIKAIEDKIGSLENQKSILKLNLHKIELEITKMEEKNLQLQKLFPR